ncbi:MAG: hypothetical protein U5K30_02025 [Acidimicrobiales bacterium]|nr:hypothetical protein [Acidimicrobiales bacterium]
MILRSDAISTIVVSSQHNANARALLSIAARNGIPSVYVPHTAGSRLREYRDLPCNLALLRGEGDRSFYAALGAPTGGLVVSGNPSVAPTAATPIDPRLGPVLALSPDPPEDLGELIAVTASAWPTGIIAPHPRVGRALLHRLAPPGWSIHEGRTFELLEHGPFAVIQHSSGVGWEALALGLPVIQLDFPGKPADYLYLDDPVVARVTGSAKLHAVLERARDHDGNEEARLERRLLAERWCARTGADAAEHMARQILEPSTATCGTTLLDGWRTGVAVAE